MTHYYDHNNFKFPSCTTIISDCSNKAEPLMQWAANQAVEWIREHCKYEWATTTDKGQHYFCDEGHLANARFAYKETSQTALDVGSEVHRLIEECLSLSMTQDGFDYTKWMLDYIHENHNEQVASAFNAFVEWAKAHDLKPMALEQTVYGDCWGGTLDFKGLFNGKGYIIDWKSSKAHYPEMRYQVAAYRSTQEPLSDLAIEGCGVLRLDKETGLPDWKDTSKTYEKDLRIFNRMKELYFERHPRIARKAGWRKNETV